MSHPNFTLGVATAAITLTLNPLLAAIDPISGIDFVRIGAVGNAPWMGDGFPSDMAIGRGQVNYEYSIGRFEVTTAQWTEFFNAALDRPFNDRLPHVIAPSFWGATGTAPLNGGQRFTVPAGNEMLPVGNISWRMAAMYCNWLHNGKGTSREAFLNGAYDVSTFFYIGNVFQDQVTHNSNAKYWIPTGDEWIKAAHYDPHKNGPGQGGYWKWNNSSNLRAEPGPPGLGDANYDFDSPSPFAIPLGAYPDVQSPWGLLDTAGGTAEWTEYVFSGFGQNTARGFEGSHWTSSASSAGDTIYSWGGDFPSLSTYELGFRIASSVPSPGPCIVLGGVLSIWCSTRRRSHPHSRAKTNSAARVALMASTMALTPALSHADIDPNSGIDFARITAIGNSPWLIYQRADDQLPSLPRARPSPRSGSRRKHENVKNRHDPLASRRRIAFLGSRLGSKGMHTCSSSSETLRPTSRSATHGTSLATALAHSATTHISENPPAPKRKQAGATHTGFLPVVVWNRLPDSF